MRIFMKWNFSSFEFRNEIYNSHDIVIHGMEFSMKFGLLKAAPQFSDKCFFLKRFSLELRRREWHLFRFLITNTHRMQFGFKVDHVIDTSCFCYTCIYIYIYVYIRKYIYVHNFIYMYVYTIVIVICILDHIARKKLFKPKRCQMKKIRKCHFRSQIST